MRMRAVEEEAWFSFLRPEEIGAISAIYLSEPSLRLNGGQAKDLFRKLKQVHEETRGTETDLLSIYER